LKFFFFFDLIMNDFASLLEQQILRINILKKT